MENYETIQKIGTGSFGSVTKIRRKSDGRILVWKEINYGAMSEKEKQQLVAEVNILRELRHPNIVRYYDRVIDKQNSKIYIVMEYCEGGDMGSVIKKCKRDRDYLPEELVWKIFMQIALALHECHKRKEGKILHRDLKPANIFLDASMNVKLGDFGLSRVMGSNSEFASTHVGTPYYMSPEQISESRYNEKSDIWSLGCLLYEFASLNPPFEATNAAALAVKIRAGKFEKLPSRYSDELQRVTIWMLNVDWNSRPSVDDLLSLPQVSLRLREKKLRENQISLKKKEEELKKKEAEIAQLEEENRLKRIELEERENKLKDLELKY
jgi:NIMA (never in mitosis gene a)-related kinase 2